MSQVYSCVPTFCELLIAKSANIGVRKFHSALKIFITRNFFNKKSDKFPTIRNSNKMRMKSGLVLFSQRSQHVEVRQQVQAASDSSPVRGQQRLNLERLREALQLKSGRRLQKQHLPSGLLLVSHRRIRQLGCQEFCMKLWIPPPNNCFSNEYSSTEDLWQEHRRGSLLPDRLLLLGAGEDGCDAWH